MNVQVSVAMPKNKSINLLPQEEFDASVVGRVLKWAMGTFRIIVIITEMIVMGAFLSRFWLDAQNSDLNEAIKIRTAQVSAQKDFEKQFRGLQTKLNVIKALAQETKPSDRVNTLTSKIPSDIVLSSVSVSADTTEIKGSAGSELSIAQLVSNLKADSASKSVDLGSISSSESNPSVTLFSIKISY